MQDMFQDLSKQIQALLLPKQYFAWQTLLLLSLFSLVVAVAVDTVEDGNPIAVSILTNMSWIFLTSAAWWGLSEKDPIKVGGFSLSPWITGIVLCMFLFHPWRSDERLRWAVCSWPMLSTGIKALPYFVNWELKFKLPKDKDLKMLITTALVNLLLSSWIVFSFRIQDWANRYPSLLVRPLTDSAFIYDFNPNREQASQGVLLLEGMIGSIEEDLETQPWYQTERWLYTLESNLEVALDEALETLDSSAEEIFWQVAVPQPREFGEGYLLDLTATWTGPVAQNGDFFLTASCKILPVEQARPVPRLPDEPQPVTQVTSVDCGEDPPSDRFETSADVAGQ